MVIAPMACLQILQSYGYCLPRSHPSPSQPESSSLSSFLASPLLGVLSSFLLSVLPNPTRPFRFFPPLSPLMPPATAPLYNHPLPDIETWLTAQGCHRDSDNISQWRFSSTGWTAELLLDLDSIVVTTLPVTAKRFSGALSIRSAAAT